MHQGNTKEGGKEGWIFSLAVKNINSVQLEKTEHVHWVNKTAKLKKKDNNLNVLLP